MTENKITPEMIALQESLFNDDFIKNVALSEFGEKIDRYGAFGKDALENTYMKTASKAPGQQAYEALFGEAVLGNGSINRHQLKQNAWKVWSSSMSYQNTGKIAKKMGIKSIDGKYSGKMIAELEEDVQKNFSSGYLQYEITGLMKQSLSDEQNGIASQLEKMLAPEPTPEKDSKESK